MLDQKIKGGIEKTVRKHSFNRIFLAIILICIIGASVFFLSPLIKSPIADDWMEQTIKPKLGDIDVVISASGTVRPEHEVKISPKVIGLVKKLYVEQGQRVKAGELIALMDDSNLIGQIDAARSETKLAEAAYDKALNGNRPQEIAQGEAQVRRAQDGVTFAVQALNRAKALVQSKEAELHRDLTNAQRIAQLAKEGAVSDQERLNAATLGNMTRIALQQAKQELRQSESALAQAKADLDTAKEQYSLLRAGTREEDVRAAKHQMAKAAGNLSFLESQLADTRIRAPFDGIISQKYADEGAIVTPTTASADLSATSSSIVSLAGNLEVVSYVSETDMEHLKLGQSTKIIANAYPDRTFHGKVKLIAPAAVVTQNVTTFEVHSTIDNDKNALLMSGMNVTTEFMAGQQRNILLVPTVCVISEKGKTGVLVASEEGKPVFRKIKAGRTAGDRTQVLEGLKASDRVFLALSEEDLKARGYSEASGGGGGGSGRGMRRMGLPRSR